MAVHLLTDELSYQGESEPAAAASRESRLEDAREDTWGDAWAVVREHDDDVLPVEGHRCAQDAAGLARCLRRIPNDVGERYDQALRLPPDLRFDELALGSQTAIALMSGVSNGVLDTPGHGASLRVPSVSTKTSSLVGEVLEPGEAAPNSGGEVIVARDVPPCSFEDRHERGSQRTDGVA